MSPIRLRLAGWVLTLYADGQVSRNCDDLDWPEWFPVFEREPLVRDMERANGGGPEEVADAINRYTTSSMCPPAWWLAAFFAEAMGYSE
jgi:hypothetical protein